MADGPEGPPEAQASALEQLFLRYRELPEDRCSIPKKMAKGMVVELAKGLADEGQPLPAALISALAIALDVEDLLADPATFFGGATHDQERSRQRNLAMHLDLQFRRRCGRQMSLKALEREVSRALGRQGPVRATLRAWRLEADYRLFVEGIGRVAAG